MHEYQSSALAELIHGAIEIETTNTGLLPHRLPKWAHFRGADSQLLMAESQPSGVRLSFRTTATELSLVTLPTKRHYLGLKNTPESHYELCIDGQLHTRTSAEGGHTIAFNLMAGSTQRTQGEPQTLTFGALPQGMKRIDLWLPHNETTELLMLRANAIVEPEARGAFRWLHHGSSISQGSNATSPTGIWPVVAAGLTGADLTNLSFGGSALLDSFTARTLANQPADFISLKIGINLVNTDLMKRRAFVPAVHGFLDTLRDRHPDTPILVISPIHCPMHETTPGPSIPDADALTQGQLTYRPEERKTQPGQLTLKGIRKQLSGIVKLRSQEDPNLHYLDGQTLYGPNDHDRLPLPDALHPDSDTHRLMGERFAAVMREMGLTAGPPL